VSRSAARPLDLASSSPAGKHRDSSENHVALRLRCDPTGWQRLRHTVGVVFEGKREAPAPSQFLVADEKVGNVDRGGARADENSAQRRGNEGGIQVRG